MVPCFLVQLSLIHHQPFGCRPSFSHQETGAAVLGVVPIVVLLDQASVDTHLYRLLDLVCLLLSSRVGPPTYLVTQELRFQLEVHLDQHVTGGWRG